MSQLGFDKIIRALPKLEKEFLKGGIELAKHEFKKNFDNESNLESGRSWDPVKRKVPPKILIEKGELRKQAIKSGTLRLYPGKAIFEIDPIDRRGRGYAEYHQEGIGVAKRAFVTQSSVLTRQQLILLDNLTYKLF